MNTIKSLVLVMLAASSFISKPGAHTQGGPHPVKLTAPGTVIYDVSKRQGTLATVPRTIFYNCTVQIDQTYTTDTTIYITDSTNALHHPMSVVVPAGSDTKSFQIYALWAPSNDTLTAYNANGSVNSGVTVTTS